MKATQTVLKSVAAMTAMGIILAGCSGGSTATRQTSNTTPTTTVPTITVPSTVDTTTNTVGATATDDIAANTAAVNALKADLAQTLAASQAAASNSQSANNKNSWILGLAIAGVGLLALERVSTAVDTGNTVGPDNKKLGFGAGLGAGLFNSKTKMTQAQQAVAKQEAAAEFESTRALDTSNATSTSRHVIGQGKETRQTVESRADITDRFAAANIRLAAANLGESKKVNGAVADVAAQQAQLQVQLDGVQKSQKEAAEAIGSLQKTTATKTDLTEVTNLISKDLAKATDAIKNQEDQIAALKKSSAEKGSELTQEIANFERTLNAQKVALASLLNPSNSQQGSATFNNPAAAAEVQGPAVPKENLADLHHPEQPLAASPASGG